MKWLFLLLLAANVALFAWLYPEGQDPVAPQPPRPGPGTLTLLSEVGEESGDASTPGFDPDQAQLVGRNCHVSRMLDSRAEANALQDRLPDGLAEVEPVEDSRLLGHWVYLPPTDSNGEARAVVQELRDAGLDDVSLVREEAYRNAISLGVFSSEERARQRQQQVADLGVTAELGERYRLGTRYRILARGVPGHSLPAGGGWRVVDCQTVRD